MSLKRDDDSSPNKNKNTEEDDGGWLQFSQSHFIHANPQLHQAAALLHSMDESLECFLCHSLYDIPISIQPCHHSFCNGCIRKALDEQKQQQQQESVEYRCPICQTPLDRNLDLSKCIVMNRSFEETARHYKTLRPLLKQALLASQQPYPRTSAPTLQPRKRSHDGDDPTKSSSSWKSKSNPWIRQQFTVEWNEAKQTWCFHCNHCQHVTLRSKEKKWNVSKLTDHIVQKCLHSNDQLRAEATSHTQGAKRARREQQQQASSTTARTATQGGSSLPNLPPPQPQEM